MPTITNYPVWPEFIVINQEISEIWGFTKKQSDGFAQWLADISKLLEIRMITADPGENLPFKTALIAPFVSELLTPGIDFRNYSLSTFLKSNNIRFGMIALITDQNGKVEKWHQSLLGPDLFLKNDLLIKHIEQTIVLKLREVKEYFQRMDNQNLWMINGRTVILDWQQGNEGDLGLVRNNISNRFRQNNEHRLKKSTYNAYQLNVGMQNIEGCLSVYDLVFMPYMFLAYSKPNYLKSLLSRQRLVSKLKMITNDCKQYFDGHDGVLHGIYNKLHDLAFEKSQIVLKQAFHDFSQWLDTDMLEQASGSGTEYSGSVYNWLIAGELKDGKNTRAQALKAYPSLVYGPAVIGINFPTRNQKAIDSAISECLPLESLLARSLGVPEFVIRSLQGLPLSDSKRKSFEFTVYIIKNLIKERFGLAEKLWPKPTKNPDQNLKQWETVDLNRRSIQHLSDKNMFERVEAYEKHSSTFRSHVIGNTNGIGDMLIAFKTQLLGPLITDFCRENGLSLHKEKEILLRMIRVDDLSKRLVMNSLVLNRTPAKIIDIGKIWHRESGRINSVVGNRKEDWPALFEKVRINGYSFEPLCSAQELEQESKLLNHCVRGYTNKCWLEPTHIIGLRKNGKALSTIELEAKSIQHLHIIQHLGNRNARVSLSEKYAANILLKGIKSKEVWVDWVGVLSALEQRSSSSNEIEIERIIGYDPLDWAKRNQVLAAWSFAIPRHLRGIDYNEWVEKLDLKMFVKHFRENL